MIVYGISSRDGRYRKVFKGLSLLWLIENETVFDTSLTNCWRVNKWHNLLNVWRKNSIKQSLISNWVKMNSNALDEIITLKAYHIVFSRFAHTGQPNAWDRRICQGRSRVFVCFSRQVPFEHLGLGQQVDRGHECQDVGALGLSRPNPLRNVIFYMMIIWSLEMSETEIFLTYFVQSWISNVLHFEGNV